MAYVINIAESMIAAVRLLGKNKVDCEYPLDIKILGYKKRELNLYVFAYLSLLNRLG